MAPTDVDVISHFEFLVCTEDVGISVGLCHAISLDVLGTKHVIDNVMRHDDDYVHIIAGASFFWISLSHCIHQTWPPATFSCSQY